MTTTEKNLGFVRQAPSKASLQEIPVPDVRDDYILVRTVAIAINPTDWTTLDAPGANGTLMGCDYAGVVEKVGKAVKKNFKEGDRVCGLAHGANDSNPQNGAFAKYIAVKGDCQMRIPDNISFEDAATIGVGVLTAGYALSNVLGLRMPSKSKSEELAEPVLIYGGSTATGTLAVQFAKLSGYKVITACSPKHFDMMKSRGADLVFDYRTPDVGKAINNATNSGLTKVFDTVSTESTAAICAQAIGSSGGIYCNLLGASDCPRPDVKTEFFLTYSLMGEAYNYEGHHFDAMPEAWPFAVEYAEVAETLLAKSLWETHPKQIMPGGLSGIEAAFEEMRQGRVSGVKLVLKIEDTKWP